MNIIRKVEVFGDSILKGIQVNPFNKRYHVNNNIGFDMLERKFSLQITNRSIFGCTITKGKALLDRFLNKKPNCAAIFACFGGNDCDFDWKCISQDPEAGHEPNTPINKFLKFYTEFVEKIKEVGIRPVITNLPPLEPQRYFDWLSRGLNRENILRWLGGVNAIYRYQELYSRLVEEISRKTGVILLNVRDAFLKERHLGRFLCEDGIHPNTEGQRLITREFARLCADAL